MTNTDASLRHDLDPTRYRIVPLRFQHNPDLNHHTATAVVCLQSDDPTRLPVILSVVWHRTRPKTLTECYDHNIVVTEGEVSACPIRSQINIGKDNAPQVAQCDHTPYPIFRERGDIHIPTTWEDACNDILRRWTDTYNQHTVSIIDTLATAIRHILDRSHPDMQNTTLYMRAGLVFEDFWHTYYDIDDSQALFEVHIADHLLPPGHIPSSARNSTLVIRESSGSGDDQSSIDQVHAEYSQYNCQHIHDMVIAIPPSEPKSHHGVMEEYRSMQPLIDGITINTHQAKHVVRYIGTMCTG